MSKVRKRHMKKALHAVDKAKRQADRFGENRVGRVAAALRERVYEAECIVDELADKKCRQNK